MNKIHKVIWSCHSHAFVVVSELADSRTSGGGVRSERRARSDRRTGATASRITREPGQCATPTTLLAAALVLALAGTQPVGAQSVTGTGDINPSFPGAPQTSWDLGSSAPLWVGKSGNGSLVIEDGGVVKNGVGHIGDEAGVQGEVIVTGAGSQWTNNGAIFVGYSGIGKLNIEDGGYVSGFNYIGMGDQAGSTGELTITGVGSKLHAPGGEVWVGDRGTGSLTIADGGSLFSYNGHIGNWDGSEGEVSITGAGSTWESTGELTIGGASSGTLIIDNGGKLTNTSGTIGRGTDAEGTVTVSGASSEWENTVNLYVGQWGDGTLTVTDGGKVISSGTLSQIGVNDGSHGEVTITGAGSQWQNAQDLYVGALGTGTLTIANGGKVINGRNGYISDNYTHDDKVTVTGTGSEWQNSNDLYVGSKNNGTLTIADGGKVSSNFGYISDGASSQGNVTVTGAGSVWENSSELLIGGGASGTLTISDEGKVSGSTVYLGASGTVREGTLNIGSAAGDAATAAGILDTTELNFRGGIGTLVFNHTDADYVFSAVLEQGPYTPRTHEISHLAGTTTLTGNSTNFDGTITVSGGTLSVDGILSGEVYAQTTGVLSGNGTLTGNVDITNSGVLAGAHNKQLRINGDVNMDATSEVNVALDSPSNTGLFDIGGDLALDGTLNVADAGAFGTGVYRIFDYAGALTDNGMDIGATPGGVSATDLQVQTSVLNQVNLVSNAAAGEMRFWDGGDPAKHGNNIIDGGSGSWLADGQNWTLLDGSANGSYDPNPSFAIFQGTADTVTVDDSAGAIGITGMQFAADGYRLEGDSIALQGAGSESIIRVGDGVGAGVTATIASALTGTSTLVKSDWGKLVLEGANTYTGGTQIDAGVLSVSSDANLGDASGTFTFNGGTLDTTASFVSDRAILVNSAARINVASATELELTGDITGGTVSLLKQGDGTLILSGTNDYGATRVVTGTLIGNVASISGNIRNAGTIIFDQASDATFTGDIKGDSSINGVMVKDGTGTLTLDGVHHPYTSSLDWTIAQGSLQAEAARFTGDAHLDGATTTLAFVDNGNATYGGVLSGDGLFTLDGTGTVQLTGNSASFSGNTNIASGTLIVDGTLGGDIKAQTSGTVSGTGTLTGNADLTNSGILAGEQGNQLRIDGDVDMDASSEVNVALGGPSGSPLFDVGGELTLDGTLNVANAGGFDAGVYRIFVYTGALNDNDIDIGTTPAGVDASDVQIQTSVANQVNLVSGAAAGELRFWDGGDPAKHGNNIIDGGSGSWLANGQNWTLFDGSDNGSYDPNPSFAIFQGTAGTVTVDDSAGAIGVTDMQFAADGYRVEGDAITLQGVGNESMIRVGDGTGSGMTATIASELTGTSRLVKSDLGTLVLEGANTYTGGTQIDAGVLSVSSDANLGDANGAFTFSGGTLTTTASFASGRAITLDSSGLLDVAATTELGLNGNLTGSGDLIKQGDGTVRLSGANAYGNTRVLAGTLIGNASSISGNIANAGIAIFDQASDASFAGNISGEAGTDGVMIKDGAGKLTLGGTSSLDWTIAQGELQTEAARFTGDAHLDGAATTLTFVDTGNAAYGGVISGNGLFTLNGAGTVKLTGDSAGFAGNTNIANGTLIVGDSSGNGALGGTFDLSGGAILRGSGTVGAGAGSLVAVSSGATIAPGNSIGTLTIAGDLVFDPGSIFEVEVDPQGTASDRIEVMGDATLNGGSVVHIGEAGSYKLNSTYTILKAGGTLTGAFDDVSSDFAFLTPGLAYDYGSGTVDLKLARNERNFDSAATTRNQKSTARGIESIGMSAGHAVYDAIAKLPDDPALIRASLDALSGEIHASTKTALIEDSRFIRNAATDRGRAAFAMPGASHAPVQAYGPDDSPMSVAPDYAGPVFWSHAFGSWGKTNDDGNAATLDRDIGGFLIGTDRQVGDWRLGVMAGYSHSNVNAHDRDSSASSDSYHLGLYGATTWGNLGLRTGAAYSRHDIDTKRSVSIPGLSDRLSTNYKADTFQAFAELGYGMEMGNTRLEPFANLAYVALHTNDYNEDGGSAALSGRSENMDVTFTTLGLRAEHSLNLGATEANLRGTLGWRHAFGSTRPESRHAFSAGNAFTVSGVPIASDSAVVEAGVDLNLTSTATFGLSYIGQIAGSARDHGVKANLAIKF